MNLFRKAKKFFGKPERKQLEKIEKLEKIIEGLVVKAEKLMKRHEAAQKASKKEQLLKEHKAVKKLLRKCRAHLAELKKQ